MELAPKSGYYYPNKFARIMIEVLEDIMGKNGLNAILNLANQSEFINNLPPDNLNREFDFADLAAINSGIEDLYGIRGGRGLAIRAGRATFSDALKSFGALAGVDNIVFKELPIQTKLRIGIPAMAKIFSKMSDQLTSVEERENDFVYTVHRCPVCWGRSGEDRPICFAAIGLIQEGLNWISGGKEFRVNESKCSAMGDDVCEFIIHKNPMN